MNLSSMRLAFTVYMSTTVATDPYTVLKAC
jgi:hypothetical protein